MAAYKNRHVEWERVQYIDYPYKIQHEYWRSALANSIFRTLFFWTERWSSLSMLFLYHLVSQFWKSMSFFDCFKWAWNWMCDFLHWKRHKFFGHENVNRKEKERERRLFRSSKKDSNCASIFVSSVGCCLHNRTKQSTKSKWKRNSKMMLESNRVLA